MRMKPLIVQDSFQHPDELKVARAQIWRIEWGGNRAVWWLSIFNTTFDLSWHIELSMCTQKLQAEFDADTSGCPFLNPETRNQWNTTD
jgi:hypothetical protein